MLVVPRGEYFSNSSYNQVHMINSYEYWKLSSEVEYVIVANHCWFSNLNIKNQLQLCEYQIINNRGLIIKVKESNTKGDINKQFIIERDGELFLVLTNSIWINLSHESKLMFITEYAKEWDSWEVCDFDLNLPAHLIKYANKFPLSSGGNCLSATLYCINLNDWILNEWVHSQTFLSVLEIENYEKVKLYDLQDNDVVVWYDKNSIIQHASFHISSQYFFNKNGQSNFNPWKIVTWSEMQIEWKDFRYEVYRVKDIK